MWRLLCQAYQNSYWPKVGVEQVPIGNPKGSGKPAITEVLPHQLGSPGNAGLHHISSNECLWKDVHHYHFESLREAASRYQIDSAFEGRKAALLV